MLYIIPTYIFYFGICTDTFYIFLTIELKHKKSDTSLTSIASLYLE